MEKIKVNIMHKLPNRVRLKFSQPVDNLEYFKDKILIGGEEIELRYSNVNNTLVAKFNPNEIDLKEMIYKILNAYSADKMLAPLDVIDGRDKPEQKEFDYSLLMSAGSLVMSGIGDACGRAGGGRGKKFQKGANMLSGGMTSAAILGHAYTDMSKNKELDLEVLPAMFLMKSFVEKPKLSTLAIALATTFGRHIIESKKKEEIETKEIKETKEVKSNIKNIEKINYRRK